MNYLSIYPTKRVQDLYVEKYKTLVKDIKEDLTIWRKDKPQVGKNISNLMPNEGLVPGIY